MVVAIIIAGLIIHAVVYSFLKKIAQRTGNHINDKIITLSTGPVRLMIILFLLNFFIPAVSGNKLVDVIFIHLISISWITSVAWLLIEVPEVIKTYLLDKLKIEEKNNLKARRIFTQFYLFQKIVVFVVVTLSFAIVLMNFDKVRNLGASILASAGIIGVIAGFAGQKIFANIFAGIQIAVSQPFRLDDVVIVENEWGWIEDITLTYVVVKIWDLRRMIVPISYFIEKPFQNWTRHTSEILGTVLIYVDYTVPIEPIREQFFSILDKSELWDKKVRVLQVTNATEHTIELRALMSAIDSSTAWDLRCAVREQLIDFIQKNYSSVLPHQRVKVLS
jgi:small-conductance mechanosensitive channel